MRDEIRQEAILCFEENGYNRTTLQEIANRTGISLQHIMESYETKEILYLALFQKCREEINYKMSVIISQNIHFQTKLLNLFSLFSDLYCSHEKEYKFFVRNLFFPPVCLKEKIQEINYIWNQDYTKHLKTILNKAYENQEIGIDQIEGMIDSYLAFSYGNMLMLLRDESIEKADQHFLTPDLWQPYWQRKKSLLVKGAKKNADA